MSIRGLRYVRLPKRVKGFEGSACIPETLALPSTTADSSMPKLLPCKRTSFQMISFKENEADWRGLEPSICSPYGVPRYQTCDHQSASKIQEVRPHIGHCTQLAISRRIGEGVEPCNMPTKASLPMRPSIRLVTQMAAHLCYTQVRAHTFKGFLMQRYALFVQPERTEQNFYFFLYQLARYLSKGYVSMLASFAQYSLRKLPLVIIMS